MNLVDRAIYKAGQYILIPCNDHFGGAILMVEYLALLKNPGRIFLKVPITDMSQKWDPFMLYFDFFGLGPVCY